MNAFHWMQEKSALSADFAPIKTYPQLSYYHRKTALGIHPRQLRKAGLPVIDQRGNANRARASK